MEQAQRLQSYYEMMWDKAAINPDHTHEIDSAFNQALFNMPRYVEVEKKTGVPWYFVACLHMRESGFNFFKCLHNGDPIDEVTTHVPKGRGPWETWEESAIDALVFLKFTAIPLWDTPKMLEMAEKYNGLGYLLYHPECPSPYLWSMTNLYSVGKYNSDGHFDPSKKDLQVGIAALLLRFEEHKLL